MSGVISSILAAAEKAECERLITPQFVRLPSFLYRAAFDEARTMLGFPPRNSGDPPQFTSFSLGQMNITDSQDGT